MRIEDFKKRQPFETPQGYFDEVESNIMKMLPTQPVQSTKARTVRLNATSRFIAYAASLVIMFAIGATLLNSTDNSTAIADDAYASEYIDEILNSYPIDDYTFNCCLTGDETNY